MTFVSYAQNYEDVILHRALKDIEKGVYVDVGAHDPVIDSVTKAFYEMGWRGINIDPIEQWHKKLVADRPDDINLHTAVSARAGKLRLFEVVDTGLSTFDQKYADRAVSQGFKIVEHTVLTRRLDEIIKESGFDVIHFLKIDVEGAEEQVLQGIDLRRFRPWIVLVEATEPNTTTPSYTNWEPLLLKRDYVYSYFDGLNRYYIAKEQISRRKAFKVPPNYFDYFVRYTEHHARQNVDRLSKEIANARKTTGKTEADLTSAREQCLQLQGDLDSAKSKLESAGEREKYLQAHTEQLRSDLVSAKSKLESAQKREDSLQARAEQLLGQLKEANNDISRLSADIGAAKAWRKQVETYLADLRDENKIMGADLSLAVEQVWRLEGRLIEKQEQVESLVESAQEREKSLQKDAARLKGELNSAKADIESARERESRLQAHATWLQNEWDAAKAKSHHWWTVADHLNHDLQSVYASKSWQITWPLRKTMQAIKWALRLPLRLVQWAFRMFKRMIKPIVVWAMRKTISRTRLKTGISHILDNLPQLKQRLRLLAVRSGVIAGFGTSQDVHPSVSNTNSEKEIETIIVTTLSEAFPSTLSERAARLYAAMRKENEEVR